MLAMCLNKCACAHCGVVEGTTDTLGVPNVESNPATLAPIIRVQGRSRIPRNDGPSTL